MRTANVHRMLTNWPAQMALTFFSDCNVRDVSAITRTYSIVLRRMAAYSALLTDSARIARFRLFEK